MGKENHFVVLSERSQFVSHYKRAKLQLHIERPKLSHNYLKRKENVKKIALPKVGEKREREIFKIPIKGEKVKRITKKGERRKR